jgi:hypothetical protein
LQNQTKSVLQIKPQGTALTGTEALMASEIEASCHRWQAIFLIAPERVTMINQRSTKNQE